MSENKDISKRDKSFESVGKVLNIIWLALFLPLAMICFMMGVFMFTIHTTSDFQRTLIGIISFLTWTIPVAVAVGVGLSFVFRKKDKFAWSVWVQLVPIVIAVPVVLLSILGFSG